MKAKKAKKANEANEAKKAKKAKKNTKQNVPKIILNAVAKGAAEILVPVMLYVVALISTVLGMTSLSRLMMMAGGGQVGFLIIMAFANASTKFFIRDYGKFLNAQFVSAILGGGTCYLLKGNYFLLGAVNNVLYEMSNNKKLLPSFTKNEIVMDFLSSTFIELFEEILKLLWIVCSSNNASSKDQVSSKDNVSRENIEQIFMVTLLFSFFLNINCYIYGKYKPTIDEAGDKINSSGHYKEMLKSGFAQLIKQCGGVVIEPLKKAESYILRQGRNSKKWTKKVVNSRQDEKNLHHGKVR